MKRKALIISNPGEVGAEEYCEGVNKDVKNFKSFLIAPYGGLWNTSEIEHLPRPSVSEVRKAVKQLKSYDYSIVIFSGHGWHSEEYDSTILQLKDGEEIDSIELRDGSPKQTIIIDCCRVVHKIHILEERVFEAMEKAVKLNPHDCKYYYNNRIEDCDRGIVGINSCAVNEKAIDDSERGGLYSYNLINTAQNWVNNNSTDTLTHASFMSIVEAHDKTVPLVERKSGNRQHPQIVKPRTSPYFPFCIVA